MWQGLKNTIARMIGYNQFNDAFLWSVGGGTTDYDTNGQTYIEEGYNVNPFVYSVIHQMSVKTVSVPIYVKNIEDNRSMKELSRLRSATNYKMTTQQLVKSVLLESKAFAKGDKDFPMDRPNPNQTWAEFISLYKTFLRLTGNVYIYCLTVGEGVNAGKPMAVYLLPSHLVQIVVKPKASFLGTENPVKSYMLIEGRNYIDFKSEDVIHIKYANPNYSSSGEHLYGQSPLRAALRNLASSNEALKANIRTMKNGGAFGFIHGKQTPLTVDQAKELKSRLIEMHNSPDDLSKIAGISAEVGFTRLSLTSDELKPFDYLKFDQKQICNVLGWSDALLNNDDGGKYDKQKHERQRVITDNIVPDLKLFCDAMNSEFLPRFKGYEDSVLEFDIMELPEMQEDAEALSKWLYDGLDRGVFNRDEVRAGLRWNETGEDAMNRYTVQNDVISLEEALDNDFRTE